MDPARDAGGALGAAALAACLLAACSGGSGARRAAPVGPEEIAIWMTPIVRWEGGAREVEFGLENVTYRTIAMATPDPAHARVEVFEKSVPVRLCGVEPRPATGGAGRVVLAPAERVPVRVDLSDACAAVVPGDYRVEVSYRAPAPAPPPAPAAGASGGEPAPRPISGTLATAYGELLVSAEAAAAPRAARRPPPGR